MTSLAGIGAAWNVFFHTPEPPLTMALFRVLFGLLLLLNAVIYLPYASLWIGPRGVLSHDRYLATYGDSRFSILRHLPPTEFWMRAVIVLHMVAAACLALGLGTRWSAVLVFVTLTSIHHRNPEVTSGGDSLMRLMSFLLIFSPAGETWSVDAALAHAGPTRPSSPWCLRLMQVQVSIVYFQSFVAKLQGESWRNGSAVYYAAIVTDYRRWPLPVALRTLWWSRLATWSTLAIEFALGPLVWIREFRYPIVLAGVCFHLVLECFMNLQLFGLIMIVCLTLFVSPYDLERLFAMRW